MVITSDLIFVMIEIDWDKTLLFDLKCHGFNPGHFEWVGVGYNL